MFSVCKLLSNAGSYCARDWSRLSSGLPVRNFFTLAIETSCDDTSVAILETAVPGDRVESPAPCARLFFHEKATADNRRYGGINPRVSVDFHQRNLATLIHTALHRLPLTPVSVRHESEHSIFGDRNIPNLVAVTRGPGMRSSLDVGLSTAKGLALAWDVPFIGVNHMQAHALAPRLSSALSSSSAHIDPQFPFISLLVSGGHTMLVLSKSLVDHEILANTCDISVGNALDHIGRTILSCELLGATTDNTNYAALLERFAFPHAGEYDYSPPRTTKEEIEVKTTKQGFSIHPPLSGFGVVKKGTFSFSGIESAIARYFRRAEAEGRMVSVEERRELAKLSMQIAFEQLCSRTVFALKDMLNQSSCEDITAVVVGGGVASNLYLRHILRQYLDIRGFSDVQLHFPPPSLCCDNAAMIAWTGYEMYKAGWVSSLNVYPMKKWSLDARTEDGVFEIIRQALAKEPLKKACAYALALSTKSNGDQENAKAFAGH